MHPKPYVVGVTEGDTRSLNYSSCRHLGGEPFMLQFRVS